MASGLRLHKPSGDDNVLKITVDYGSRRTTIRLEGKLSGPWVRELERTWLDVVRNDGVVPAQVDLTDVTFISAEGKKVLGDIHRQGAELRADGFMKLIVERLK